MALPQTTLKRYFALLEATFLVQLLRPGRETWAASDPDSQGLSERYWLLAYLLGVTVDRLKGEGMWLDRFWRTLC